MSPEEYMALQNSISNERAEYTQQSTDPDLASSFQSDVPPRQPYHAVPYSNLRGTFPNGLLRTGLDANNMPVQASAAYPLGQGEDIGRQIEEDEEEIIEEDNEEQPEEESREDLRNNRRQASEAQSRKPRPRPWSREEDALLRNLRESGMKWAHIIPQIPGGRNHGACRVRWRFILVNDLANARPSTSAGEWCPEEDALIREGKRCSYTIDRIASDLRSRTYEETVDRCKFLRRQRGGLGF